MRNKIERRRKEGKRPRIERERGEGRGERKTRKRRVKGRVKETRV